jgi:L-lactate dehydrogenase complex protein LldG
MSREAILGRIRLHLGRTAESSVAPPPAVRISVPRSSVETRVADFTRALEALAGKVFHAGSPEEALAYATGLIGDCDAVASNAPALAELGITLLPRVRTAGTDRIAVREACASARVGITGADYALANTGSLVIFSSDEEARLISLLPPIHLAVVRSSRMLTGLDELLTIAPRPADLSSSMVLITGPSRTADIEQILIRGVHGPGELHVIVL